MIADTIDNKNGPENRDMFGISFKSLSFGFVHDMKTDKGSTINKLIYRTSLLLRSVPS